MEPGRLNAGRDIGMWVMSVYFDGLDFRLGAEAHGQRERHMMAAGGDIVIVHREAEGIGIARFEDLVVDYLHRL